MCHWWPLISHFSLKLPTVLACGVWIRALTYRLTLYNLEKPFVKMKQHIIHSSHPTPLLSTSN